MTAAAEPGDGGDPEAPRLPALAGVGLLTISYAGVLYHVSDVVGSAGAMAALLAASLVGGVLLGRFVGVRVAGTVTALVLAGGLVGYVFSVPASQRALLLSGEFVDDTVALLSGLSVLRLTNAGVWALAVAPAPVVLSWYLAVRRRYVGSVAVGGVALGLLVLTGDATAPLTLVGVVGGTAAVGLGEMDHTGATRPRMDTLVAVVAAMVVVTAGLSATVGGTSSPLLPEGQSPTVESSLVEAEDDIDILGSIRLSPQVRFEVESDAAAYWQTAAYDRYTGGGWVRTGDAEQYRGRIAGPPGPATTLRQEVTARTPLGALPAAWKPVRVEGAVAESTLVTPQGTVRPTGAVASGETYTVTSRRPRYTADRLRDAGTAYPTAVETTYTQLPDSTPDRVRRKADEVTAGAETPYDAAVAIERYLEREKTYSLRVEEPEGSIADAFLFEMDAGYCTYYATTMVTMLRSQGIPARFVVGYTPGEPTGDGEFVVRGLDSHAWVQVYFPDVGWVRFDPTPAGPRQRAERERVERARADAESGVDDEPEAENGTSEGETGSATATPTVTATATATPAATAASAGRGAGGTGGIEPPELPSRRTLAVWAVALAGAVAVGRRAGWTRRLRDGVRARVQRRSGDPDADAVRAYRRLETLFGGRYRPRRPGETPRAYVEAMVERGADDRATGVVDAYERARHGDGVDPAVADEVVETVDELAWAATPVVGRVVADRP